MKIEPGSQEHRIVLLERAMLALLDRCEALERRAAEAEARPITGGAVPRVRPLTIGANALMYVEQAGRGAQPVTGVTSMDDQIITGDSDETMAAEIQDHAARVGWGGVDPLTQQRVVFRATRRDAVVQKRGPMFFAASIWPDGQIKFAGPSKSKIGAARAAAGLA